MGLPSYSDGGFVLAGVNSMLPEHPSPTLPPQTPRITSTPSVSPSPAQTPGQGETAARTSAQREGGPYLISSIPARTWDHQVWNWDGSGMWFLVTLRTTSSHSARSRRRSGRRPRPYLPRLSLARVLLLEEASTVSPFATAMRRGIDSWKPARQRALIRAVVNSSIGRFGSLLSISCRHMFTCYCDT